MKHYVTILSKQRKAVSSKKLLPINSKYSFAHCLHGIEKQSSWRKFSSSLNSMDQKQDLKQQQELEKSNDGDNTDGNNNSSSSTLEQHVESASSDESIMQFSKFSSPSTTTNNSEQVKSGFISSMNILQFTDDSELDECNRIISSSSSLLDNLENNHLTTTATADGNNNDLIAMECNALLKRAYIEIYFLREYEKAKLDIILVRKLVGENIDEELNRFLSQLHSFINIEILNDKISVANSEGNNQVLIPLIEKRSLELANVGKYKQSLEDLDFNIQLIEKLLKANDETMVEQKTKFQTQLLNLYKERMNLFVSIKVEMERLLSVGQELSSISHHDSDSQESVLHFYFTKTSLVDPRHKLNGGNMDLIREFESIFVKEEERAILWDISHSRTFQKNILPLSVVVIEKCVNEISNNLKRAEELIDNTNPSYHFSEIKRAIEDDIKKQKTQKINKYIIYVGFAISLIFLILSSPKVGVLTIKKN